MSPVPIWSLTVPVALEGNTVSAEGFYWDGEIVM